MVNPLAVLFFFGCLLWAIFFFYILLINIYFFKSLNKIIKFNIYWFDFWLNNNLYCAVATTFLFYTYVYGDGQSNTNYNIVLIIYGVLIIIGFNNIISNLFKTIIIYYESKGISRRLIFQIKSHFIIFFFNVISTASLTYCVTQSLFDIPRKNYFEDLCKMEIFRTVRCVDTVFTIFVSVINIKYLNILRSNVKLSEIKYDIDFLIYKILIDVIFNIPLVTFIHTFNVDIKFIFLSGIVWLIYIIFNANLLFTKDRSQGSLAVKRIRQFFFFQTISIKIGDDVNNTNEVCIITNINNLDNDKSYGYVYPKKENNVHNIHENYYNHNFSSNTFDFTNSNINVTKIPNNITKLSNLSELERNFTQVNFFLIFKLIHYHFRVNEKLFEKKIRDQQLGEISYINNQSIISRRSEIIFSNFISKHNILSKSIFNSLEDKDMQNLFEQINPDCENISFSIDSLFTDYLFELIKFYAIDLKDVINSLNSGMNRLLLKTLFEKKFGDKNFNQYFTRDTFLLFEIYEYEEDKNLFLNKLENFLKVYKDYITQRFLNWKSTFLPLIIGIYNIQYVNYDKIIILYRHPLAFTPFLQFKYWVNKSYGLNKENISISTSYSELVKNVEIKSLIKLHRDDYAQVEEILKSDFNILKKLDFKSYYNLNVFKINDVKRFLSSFNASLHNENETEKDDFLKILGNTDYLRDSLEKSRRDYGSGVINTLDKILIDFVVDSRFIVKIYFSEIFSEFKDAKKNSQGECSNHNRNLAENLYNEIDKIIKSSDNFNESDIYNYST